MTLREALERMHRRGVRYVEFGPYSEIVGTNVRDSSSETVGDLAKAAQAALKVGTNSVAHVGTGQRRRVPTGEEPRQYTVIKPVEL